MKKAFTLIELLVVIFIIGLIASVSLMFVEQSGDVKALQYSKKIMKNIKNKVSSLDEDGYYSGIVNDLGTMLPNANFLTSNKSVKVMKSETNLGYFRFNSLIKQDGSLLLPAPFMYLNGSDWVDFNISANALNLVLYSGYRGGYFNLSENKDEIVDGWNTAIELKSNLNLYDNYDDFLVLKSAGVDKIFSTNINDKIIKKEFDLSAETNSLESVLGVDENLSFSADEFSIRHLSFDINLKNTSLSGAKEVAIFIYSPMLYYVDDTTNLCEFKTPIVADCAGSDKAYKPYIAHDKDYNINLSDKNVTWQSGVIKYQFLLSKDDNEGYLFINESNIKERNATEKYDFNVTTSSHIPLTNIANSNFFIDMSINDTNSWNIANLSTNADEKNPFYIFSGEKIISIWAKTTSWNHLKTYRDVLKPGRDYVIRN